ncbi:MAG TPA: TIGR02587 family membrane protein [Acidimicrobiales bacterium]|nr:TIGR02587 family membrane protein [Acidimicrobiales bacterium]
MASESRGPWATELVDIVRAASGGLLFGIPLLYTMEVWWVGSYTDPRHMLVVLAITFCAVTLLNRTSGFRDTKDVRLRDALADSVEALVIALACVTLVLLLLREITGTTPIQEALGKIVYESTPFAIGIALAHHFLRRGRDAGDDESDASESQDSTGQGTINATLADVGATTIGAVFVAFNIAPTDEIPMLAAAMPPGWLLGVIGASLLVSYLIVFVAGFSNQEQRHSQKGVLQHPITETFACYLVALAAAAVMLWFFQRAAVGDPVDEVLSHVIVLGLPAAVGGAAGRLAV